MGFPKAARKTRSTSWDVSVPPLPWPSRIRSWSRIGVGQDPNGVSEDIVLAQCDVELIPQQVEEDRVDLLDAVDAEGRDHEAMLRDRRHAAAVASRERDRQHPHLARRLQAAGDVGRLAGR